jgi:glutamyl/glutaminyl-tRNA synthetase
LNYLSLLGWNPGTEQELFTRDELVQAFDLTRVQKHGAIFDDEKLRWFNQEHMRRLPTEELHQHVLVTLSEETRQLPQWNIERLERFTPVLLERISTFGDISALEKSGDIAYIFSSPEIDIARCSWKSGPQEIAKTHLTHVYAQLEQLSDWSSESLKSAVWDYATKNGRGEVLWPLRYSLTGKEKSPDPFTMAYILGKEETLARIRGVLDRMG